MQKETAEPLSAKAIFLKAMELTDERQRQRWLQLQCGDNPELLCKVEALLVAAGRKSGASPLDVVADAMGVEETVLTSDLEPSPEAPTKPLPPRLERQQIGPYKLLEQIGQGGFGTVYMAEQTSPVKRKVALKVLKPGMDSNEVIARFEAERQALAMMDHPNIARVLDGGTTEQGRPYFVMELVRGVLVTDYCDEVRATTEERLALFVDICRAVQHAHQKGIIHRDLKPSNVLVTMHDDKPVPKVIDFGIAKALSQQLTERTLFTGYQQMLGTPAYMSPEQAQMSGIDIDTRSDVYSLGVLLYELLTGTTPFDKSSLAKISIDDLRKMIREQDPPRPSIRITTMEATLRSTMADRRRIDQRRVSEELRGELDWIVMKALEKDRNRRYESASALRADIECYFSDQPVTASPPSHVYQVSKWVRRNRILVTTTAIVLMSLLLGLTGTVIQANRAWQAEALAAERFEKERIARIKADEESVRANQERQRADAEADRARAASTRAINEAAIAAAITDFLQNDLLAQADISNQFASGFTGDPDITLAALLDRASANIGGKFADMPTVECALRYTLAECYCSLGKYDQAAEHIERAVEIGRNDIGLDHPGTLKAICAQAGLTRLRGDLKTAENLLLEVQQVVAANGYEGSDVGRMVLGQILVLRFDQGRSKEAIQVATTLLELCETSTGPESPETLTTMSNIAVQFSALGEESVAESMHRKIYESRLRSLGSAHPDTLNSIKNLAISCDTRGDYKEAKSLFEQAAEGYTALYGPDHPETLSVQINLAHVLTRQSMLNEAKALLLDTIDRLESTVGKENDITTHALERLAMVYEMQFHLREALELRKSLLDDRIDRHGEGHARTISARANYAGLLRKMKRTEEADAALRQAVEAARESLGDEHPVTLTLLNNLAVSYFDAKNYEAALKLFKEIEAVRLSNEGPVSLDVLTVRTNIASVLKPLGHTTQARELLQATLAQLEITFGQSHPAAVETKKKLIEHLEADESLVDRYAQAESFHRQLIADYKNSRGLEAQGTLGAAQRLVTNLHKQNRAADAVAFCREQISTAKQIWGKLDIRTVKVAHALATSLLAAGSSGEAEMIDREIYASTQSLAPDDPIKLLAIGGLVQLLNKIKRHHEALQIIETNILAIQSLDMEDSTAMRRMNGLKTFTARIMTATDVRDTESSDDKPEDDPQD